MSEQSPYAAPVPTPGMYPPPPGVPMNPPAGFMPPPPAPGYAPPPPAAPAAFTPGVAPAVAAPPVPHYDSPGMTLTELSFAPLPTAAPAPVAVEPPPPAYAAPHLVQDVLPSGGKMGRGLSVGGGRTPLIALVLVLLLGGAGVFFGTGLFKSKAEPAPVVPAKKVVKPAPAPAAAKPKPAAKQLVGTTITLNKANSGTLGSAYTMTAPTGWKIERHVVMDGQNFDVQISHPSGQRLGIMTVDAKGEPNGPISAADLADFKKGILSAVKDGMALPGSPKATVGGIQATGFDYSQTTDSGDSAKLRGLAFVRNGTGYVTVWVAEAGQFADSLTTMNQMLATVKFA